ncbi:RHS repeat-associated core domain-containing protein [Lentzea albida]|uniref:RHS repeat-associated core domain-containing protein n=1 Tax=Lentzea albida TaxID=65499 RepID=UPI0011607756|nr:RHS repeat-associated core domain-containing protein [Lentzea albida]
MALVLSVVSGAELPPSLSGTFPLGASTTPPQQQTGTAEGSTHEATSDSTRARNALAKRDQPRPANAVADQPVPLPEVSRSSPERQKVTPKVEQPASLDGIDPNATERPQDRTDTTRTFDNPDGTHTVRVHNEQVNVRQSDGTYLPVDLALVPSEGRLKPKNSPADTTIATTSARGDLVRLAFGPDHRLTYGLRDAAEVRGEVDGAQVTYRAVRPEVDLRLTATRTGVKEDLVLASAGAPTSFSFTLTTERLQPRLTSAGDVELVDGDRVVAMLPAGFMDDAAGVRSRDVRYALDKAGDRTWTLRMDLDQAWLFDSQRVFPVTVDPTVGTFNTSLDDTYVQPGSPSGHSSEVNLIAGAVGDGRGIGRAYLHFPLPAALSNKYVVGASLALNNSDPSCTQYPFTAFEVTQSWTGTGISWPGAAVGQALGTGSLGSCANNRWSAIPLNREVMTSWTHNRALANGISVRASNEANGTGHRFASANAAAVNTPYLDVRYSDEGASFEVAEVLLPTANRAGSIKAKVTNLGSSTWTPGNGFKFGFNVRRASDNAFVRTESFAPAISIAPTQTGTFEVPISPLNPDEYRLELTMFTPGGANFRDAHEVPFGVASIKVSNVPPMSNNQQPGTGAVVETNTPTLYADPVDDDNWPGKGFNYKFRICTDAALTADCQESDWTAQSWAPAALRWHKTYYWSVKVHDTVDATPDWVGARGVGPLAITTRVAQPQITSHLAGSPDSVQGPGLDAGIGNYSTVVTDATVATAGPDLTITRTYNSLDPRRDTAFGVGWASRLDMRLKADDDGSENVVVTYPTGRQVRFGKNPGGDNTFSSPLGDSTDLVLSTATGIYTLRDNSGSKWEFDILGRLARITDPAGLVQTLDYNSGDRPSTITSSTSNRALTLTWQGTHVTKVTTQAPEAGGAQLEWTYSYTGDRMTSACVPGAAPNCTDYEHTQGNHYRSTVVDDNPKAYWRLGETSGTAFANVMARRPGQNSAAMTGVVLGGDGALGGTTDKAATFDGVSSYATLPDDMTTATMSASVELWFKTTSHGTLISYSDKAFPPADPGATKSTPLLYVGTDGLLYGGFTLRDNGGARQIVSGNTVNDDQWHHVVLSAAINKQTMYLDGVKVGDDLNGYVDHRKQGKYTLGAGHTKDWPATNGGNHFFAGAIDEVAVYTRPLGSLAAAAHFGARSAIDELTAVKLPQDARQFVKLTYDNVNDRVKTMVDHVGRTWTMDVPQVLDSTRTTVLRGPANHGDWTYRSDIDNGGRLQSRVHRGRTVSFEYNTAGFRSALVDENGKRSEFTTDDRGNVLSNKTCRAAGSCNTTYFTYVTGTNALDPRGDKVESISDGRSTDANDTRYRRTYQYDSVGRLLKTTYPLPDGFTVAPVETNTYSTGNEQAVGGGLVPAGLLVKSVGRRGDETVFSYRSNGDLATQVSPSKLHTRFTYDAIGRQKTVTTANPGGAVFGTTTYEYTPRSQIAKVTEPAVVNPLTGITHTKVTTNQYDGNGNVVEAVVSDLTPVLQGGDAARVTKQFYDANDRLVRTEFPDGGVERTEYLDDTLTEVATDVRGTVWTTRSDEEGRILSRSTSGVGVDPLNPQATSLAVEFNSYDPVGRLSATTDAMGRTRKYTYYDDGLLASTQLQGCVRPNGPCDPVLEDRVYDPAGNLVEQVVTGGRKTVQTFDAAGFLTKATFDPDGLNRSITYQRDAAGLPTRTERRGAADPNRVETTVNTYDTAGEFKSEDAFLNVGAALTTSVDRDERGLVVKLTNRRQLSTSFTYNAAGELVNTVNPPTEVWVAGTATQNFAATETLGRNAFGEVTHARDAAGGVSTTKYDSMGRVVEVAYPSYTAPGGTPVTPTARTEYNFAGDVTKTINALDRVTTNTHDPYGRVRTTTLPQVGATPTTLEQRYDRVGQLLTSIDPLKAEIRYTYDELGRKLTTTETDTSSGSMLFYTSQMSYDIAGNLLESKTPQGFATKHTYNKAGEVLSTTDPTGVTTEYGYDIAGRVTTTTDPAKVVSSTTYDLLGRPTATAHLVGGVKKREWATTYHPSDQVATVTTPEGRVTRYEYDERDRLDEQVEKVDATKSITTSFGYDKLGNRSRFVDGNSRATTYTYNSTGLPESIVEPPTPDHPNTADRTWTTSYDRGGQAVKLVKPGGVTVVREYDEQGRLTTERGTGAETTTADRTVGYDKAGRTTSVSGPRGVSTYRYDDRGNLLESAGPAGAATYTYNGDGTLATRTDVTGTATFGYDNAGRMTSVVDPVTGRTADYGYDEAGRVSLISDRTVANRINRRIGYDELGRKSTDQVQQMIDVGLPPRVVTGTDYGYDRDDKMTSKSAPGAANTYTYDGAGRLSTWKDNAGTVTSYGWDDAGNRTSAGGQTFTYDERNRLKSGGGSTYTYSARGTLASTTTNGTTNTSAFDAFDQLTASGAARYSYDAVGRVADRNGTRFQYAGLSNEAVTDGSRQISRLPDGTPFSDRSATGSGRMLFADQHGDVISRYLGGSVDGKRALDPFGKTVSSSGDVSPIGYQGDWTDADTGAVNMTARWYSPGTGQFQSRDPLEVNPSPSAAGNRYAYGNNDPVGHTDPTGHNPAVCGLGAFAGPAAPAAVGGCLIVAFAAVGVAAIIASNTRAPSISWPSVSTQSRPEQRNCRRRHCGNEMERSVCRSAAECDLPSFFPGRVTLPRPPAPNSPVPPSTTGIGNPYQVVLPPPPPAWIVNALNPWARSAAGSHVRYTTNDVALMVNELFDKNYSYMEGSKRITREEAAANAAQANRTSGDFCKSIGLLADQPIYAPMEDIKDFTGPTYHGIKPKDAKRATGGAVCLETLPAERVSLKTKKPAGWVHEDAHGNKMHSGHLVGDKLRGANQLDNLVPQWQHPNSPHQRSIERSIKNRVLAGENVYLHVTAKYADPEDAIPQSTTLVAIGSKGFYCVATIDNIPGKNPNAPKC